MCGVGGGDVFTYLVFLRFLNEMSNTCVSVNRICRVARESVRAICKKKFSGRYLPTIRKFSAKRLKSGISLLQSAMDDTVLPPSPNWFQVSGLAVSKDGWLVYGGPSKSLCALEPLPADDKALIQGRRYRAHVYNRANGEKIVSVDISPEWPEKRTILTGSADGAVKQWNLEPLLQSNIVKLMLSHDIHRNDREEVAGVGYSNESTAITVGCNGNVVKWDLNSNVVKTFHHIRNFRPTCMACSPHLPLHVAIGTKQGVVVVLDLNGSGKFVYKVRGQDDEIANVSWCPKYELSLKKTLSESEKRATVKTGKKALVEKEPVSELLEASGVGKNLPDDSFDESAVVPEDDMFDIYKDHAADEFGHKKYQPEEIYVKVSAETKQDDYLAECLKLKDDILKQKAEGESSMQSLVDALDSTHVDSEKDAIESNKQSDSTGDGNVCNKEEPVVASEHIHKHLLATIGKHGGIRIWSKAGKLVGSCAVPHAPNKNQKMKVPYYPTLLWYKPDVLVLADGKNQLLECNPLKIDCKNKLDWSLVHTLHKRVIYCIASNAPRMQTGSESDSDWVIYTTSQDRNIVQYSLHSRKKVAQHATCGGFVYTVAPCPYDAAKVAASVGDGSVRIWESSTLEDDDTKLNAGHVTTYWQNVQGKVLVVAWHPTWENVVAFSTAESRIGLIDVSSKSERPARVLIPALSGPIYSISWGEGNNLYACANGDLVLYQVNKPDEAPMPIKVEPEGRQIEVSFVRWYGHALVCGSVAGCVCVMPPQPPHAVRAATIVYSKMIHTVDWHPQQTSNSSEESPYKNLIAVCSMEKHGKIVILEYIDKEDDSKQLQTYKTLEGHKLPVLQVMWNPHIEARLLSTSQDGTVRVWDAVEGACLSIFEGHSASSLGASWAAYPQLPTLVLSGGGDCTLRAWDARACPEHEYKGNKAELMLPKKDKKKKEKKDAKLKDKQEEKPQTAEQVPTHQANREIALKGPKKFLLPILHKPMSTECQLSIAKTLFKMYLETTPNAKRDLSAVDDTHESELVQIFGSVKDVNDLLDTQMERHLATNNVEGWIMLAIFRGHIDDMVQFASQQDILCPYLLSLAPCVSLKYWKDATQLYLAQIDRLVAKGEEDKLAENKSYGGPVFRKAASLLGVHDVKAAVHALTEAKLFKEAYILCRIRYLDSIAQETLRLWAQDNVLTGLYVRAAICYIVLGELSQAAKTLGKVNDEDCLNLAASIAKAAGQNMLADHIAEKRENIKSTAQDNTEEILEQLPSRIELLMKDDTKTTAEPDDTEGRQQSPAQTELKDTSEANKEKQKLPAQTELTKDGENCPNGESKPNGHGAVMNGNYETKE